MNGDGVARVALRERSQSKGAITVPFTIPGERIRASVHRSRDGSLVGVVEEMLEPSRHRVAPGCLHFGNQPRGGCGGCSWQHIAYPEQLRLKSDLVTRLVREAIPRAPAAHPTIASTPADSPWRFRQKVHFVFGSGTNRAGAGHGTLRAWQPSRTHRS